MGQTLEGAEPPPSLTPPPYDLVPFAMVPDLTLLLLLCPHHVSPPPARDNPIFWGGSHPRCCTPMSIAIASLGGGAANRSRSFN